jgi:hypothetical protein
LSTNYPQLPQKHLGGGGGRVGGSGSGGGGGGGGGSSVEKQRELHAAAHEQRQWLLKWTNLSFSMRETLRWRPWMRWRHWHRALQPFV